MKLLRRFSQFILTSTALLVPQFVFAQAVEKIFDISSAFVVGIQAAASTVIMMSIYGVMFVIGKIGSLCLIVIGYILDFGLQLNATVIDQAIVKSGWVIVRDVSNIGFLFAILVIAFTIVTRTQTHGTRELFGKLLIAAVLINFSLVISGFFIDAGGVFSSFFKDRITTGGTTVAENMLAATSYDKILSQFGSGSFEAFKAGDPAASGDQALKNGLLFGPAVIQYIANLFFVALFTFFLVAGMTAVTVMVYVRFLWLIGLLILAPAAWLSFATPQLSKYFSEWWDYFLRWTFFLPASMFFLYLSVLAGTTLGDTLDFTFKLSGAYATGSYTASAIGGLLPSFAQMIVVIGLAMMGLLAGEKLGGSATKMAFTAGNWARGKVTGGGPSGISRGVLGAYLRGGVDKNGASRGERLHARIQTGGAFYAPLRGLAENIEKMSKPSSKTTEIQARLGSIKNDGLLTSMANKGGYDEETAIALTKELAKRGKLKTVDSDGILNLKRASKGNEAVEKEIAKVRPDMVGDRSKIKVTEAMNKLAATQKGLLPPAVFRVKNADGTFNEPSVFALFALSNSDLLTLIKNARKTDEIKEVCKTIKKAIADLRGSMHDKSTEYTRLNTYVTASPGFSAL